jgi:hypothetical protein
MTENLTREDTFDGSAWELTPFYVPELELNVSPPQDQTGFEIDTTAAEELRWGALELRSWARYRIISPELHEELLTQSIEEYGNIWKTLAQM